MNGTDGRHRTEANALASSDVAVGAVSVAVIEQSEKQPAVVAGCGVKEGIEHAVKRKGG